MGILGGVGYRRLPYDGGTIEYVIDGPEDARDLLLFHGGSPSAAAAFPGLTRAAAAAGMRTAIYSRAGYGRSTRRPGRSVADEAAISAALVDRLGHDAFFTAGWSGGGPVALACAALLPRRVRACLTLASPAPRLEVGAAWRAWIRPEDLPEWDVLASGDPTSVLPSFAEAVAMFGRMTPRRLTAFPGGSDADRRWILDPGGVGRPVTRSMRRAVLSGYFGFLDDNLAQARDWGFRVADIRVPVVVRQGELDGLVKAEHGRWLARTIPGARGVFLPDAGHGAVTEPWEEVVGQLVSAAQSGQRVAAEGV